VTTTPQTTASRLVQASVRDVTNGQQVVVSGTAAHQTITATQILLLAAGPTPLQPSTLSVAPDNLPGLCRKPRPPVGLAVGTVRDKTPHGFHRR